MLPLKSLSYFAAVNISPMFAVPEVFNDNDHPANALLMADMDSIPEEDLQYFQLAEPDLKELMSEKESIDDQWKLYFIMEELTVQISSLRIHHLTAITFPLAPYDHPDLKGLPVDKNGLVNMHDLQGYDGGFSLGDEVFTMAPSTPGINSTYWVLKELYDQSLSGRVKIRLDPLIHRPKKDFFSLAYRMQTYGKTLDWDRISQLDTIEHTEFVPVNQERSDLIRTEITWRPSEKEIHFTCEELPNAEKLNIRGSRYFHAIIYKDTGVIEHCDGANRFYSPEQYKDRLENHIKVSEMTKAGTRIKLFHVTEPSHEILVNLITAFFVWNDDILLYFNPDLKNHPYFQQRYRNN